MGCVFWTSFSHWSEIFHAISQASFFFMVQCSMISFLAELKKVDMKKSLSLDRVFSVVVSTDDPVVLKLGEFPADTLFRIQVEKE
mgnify:CR=1 FL=1